MISSLFRFHGHNSLRYVYTNGQAVRSQMVTMKSTPNAHRKHSRVSVVVSKKILKKAVGRNRIRRRLYEYVRTHLDELNGVYDIVLIVTSAEIRTIPYDELSSMLDQIFHKAALYKTSEN